MPDSPKTKPNEAIKVTVVKIIYGKQRKWLLGFINRLISPVSVDLDIRFRIEREGQEEFEQHKLRLREGDSAIVLDKQKAASHA